MTSVPAPSPWQDATAMAALHACRTQAELESEFAAGLAALLPGVAVALCLAIDAGDGEYANEVRFTIGDGCPLQANDHVAHDAWPLPAEQRLAVRGRQHELGELLLGALPSPDCQAVVEDALTHFGTAVVNLVLDAEARQATDDYCATLQALEEGIVLFQEADAEAVAARLLALASTMVQATGAALYVLDEVGNRKSDLRLQQVLGIPDSMLATFCSEDGSPWPDNLLDAPTQVVDKSESAGFAGLLPECVPAVLQQVVVLPLRYHGVHAGVCLLFNPLMESAVRKDIGRLQSFGQLAAALLHRFNLERIMENNVSIECELAIAETIQKRLVPSTAPPCDAYEFAWRSLAAKRIGGDYVDLTMSEDGDINAIVADASGHGINSALLMTSFRANYRGGAVRTAPLELAGSLNEEVVHEVGPTGMFITAVLLRIDRDTRRMSLSSAGHNPTMLFRAATGEVELIESHGPPMGFMAGAEYDAYQTELAAGDVLLLYTDGITEGADQELEMYGEDRLTALLQRSAADSAEDVLEAVLADLQEFTGAEHYDDDVSLIVIKAK